MAERKKVPYNESQKNATLKYRANNLKRISLSFWNEEYERLKSHCDSVGMSVASFIKEAVDEYMAVYDSLKGGDKDA